MPDLLNSSSSTGALTLGLAWSERREVPFKFVSCRNSLIFMSAYTRSGIKNPMCPSLTLIHQTRILRISPIFPKKKTLGILRSVQCAVNFRPCIDIHEGKVKQIVGSTLQDTAENSSLITNFESNKSPAEFADLYKQDGLLGGHVIMLGADDASKSAATGALHAYPGGMQAGGGINSENAIHYLEQGASHVIVTSYVFRDGKVNLERLKHLVGIVGKHKLVLDLSCRKMGEKYVIVTDRWQKFSNLVMDEESLAFLATYADEFLVHGVEVEGKRLGIDEELVILLGRFSPIPVTYAGGVTTMADLEKIKTAGRGRVDVSIGSALDIFGGELAYEKVVAWHYEQIKYAAQSIFSLENFWAHSAIISELAFHHLNTVAYSTQKQFSPWEIELLIWLKDCILLGWKAMSPEWVLSRN